MSGNFVIALLEYLNTLSAGGGALAGLGGGDCEGPVGVQYRYLKPFKQWRELKREMKGAI